VLLPGSCSFRLAIVITRVADVFANLSALQAGRKSLLGEA
jgi:hypothetical protein